MAHAQTFTNIRATQTMIIRSLVEDEQHRIWFASGKSVYCLDGEKIRTHSNEVLDRLGAINCICLSEDKLLVGSERGMAVLSLKDGSSQPVEELEGQNVRALLMAYGHEWVGTDSILFKDRQPHGQPMEVKALCAMDSGVYVGGRNVLRLNKEGVLQYDLGWDNSASVVSLSADESGDILMGTAFGLIQMDKELRHMTSDLLYVPVVKCMMRDPRDVLLVGSDGGLFEKQDVLEPIHHDSRDPRSFAGNVVWSMMKDHAGNLWVGSDNGLSVMTNDQSFAITRLASITGSGQGNQIYCMHLDNQDRLWIGGTNGIVRVEKLGRSNQHHVWYERSNMTQRLPHNRIRKFYEDPVCGMWACTDGGLLHYNEHTEQWDRINITEDPHNWVYNVERDEDALVVTTFDGVYRATLDPETSALQNIQRIDATPHLEYTYGKVMLGDSEWSLTPNGLAVKRKGKVQHFELPEKFISIYYHAGDDRIFLGGADQFAIIHPKQFLEHKAAGLWFDPDARFVDADEEDNANFRRVAISLGVALVALVIVIVLYFRQRRRLKVERERRLAMLKSAADKMASLEQHNSNLSKQLRMQQLAGQSLDESTSPESGTADNEQTQSEEQYLLRVNKAIKDNIDNPDFSVSMLSEIMGVNNKQLYRRIKQYSDLTAVEYIRKMRLQKAASLLQNPDFTINEVMYMVGFTNPSYFSRSFATEFGMTPTEYRNRSGR